MLKYIAVVCIVFSLSINIAWSQDIDSGHKSYSHWIMGVPQHLFKNGIRVEWDKKLGRPGVWINYAPTIYYRGQRGNRLFGNYDVYSTAGAGMDVMLRWYPQGIGPKGGFYLSGGGGFRFLVQEFRGYRWTTSVRNGLTWYEYDESSWNRETQNYVLKGTLGYLLIINRHLAADFFIGIGLQAETQKLPSGTIYEISEEPDVFGGTGLITLLGFRLGIGW